MISKFRLAALTTILGLLPGVCRADGFDSLKESLIRLVSMSAHPQLNRFDYDGNGCLFGHLLNQGEQNAMIRTFEADKTYMILGAGDNDVRDMDLWITPSGQPDLRLAQDIDDDATPVVRFTPQRTARYAINSRNERSNGLGFCTFVILVESQYAQYGLKALAESLDNIIAVARVRGLFAKEFPRNNLVLFGGKFENGESSSIFDLVYPRGHYAVVATGSSAIKDADLFVTRQSRAHDPAGREIARDDQQDSTPDCEFSADGVSSYGVEMKNARSTRSGFIFGFVLRD